MNYAAPSQPPAYLYPLDIAAFQAIYGTKPR